MVRNKSSFRWLAPCSPPAFLWAALCLTASAQVSPLFSSVKPILEAVTQLPLALTPPSPAKWTAWRQKADSDIRARLTQGDLDTMVNLLLFGTSFTTHPRIQVETLADASRTGLLRARLNDLLAGFKNPADERLSYLRALLITQGINPDDPQTAGAFIFRNLQRVLQEKVAFAQRTEAARASASANAQPTDNFRQSANLFRDRGISLDTTILPNFGVEAALAEMQKRGILKPGTLARVAIIGPGLDFVDKDSGFDYYPLQTLQPFAIYDSLLRLGLSKPGPAGLKLTVLDISQQVLGHLNRSRTQAQARPAPLHYDLQLPRDPAQNLSASALEYWTRFGSEIGAPIEPIHPTGDIANIQTRAIRIRPAIILALQPIDLNIVTQRLSLPAIQKFDLIVATNMFIYYDTLEQALAMQNVAAMLKPGGLLLTNDELAALPVLPLHKQGEHAIVYSEGARQVGDTMLWYGR